MNVSLAKTVFVIYMLSSILYLFHFFSKKAYRIDIPYFILILAFLLHSVLLLLNFLTYKYLFLLNLFNIFNILTWIIIGLFILLHGKRGIKTLAVILVPLATFMMVGPAFHLNQEKDLLAIFNTPWLPIHVLISVISEGLFGLAFASGVIYLIQEKKIKKKKIKTQSRELPSLEFLDLINEKSIALGFLFLTIGIITGALWSRIAWGAYWLWEPKQTLTLVIWIIYAILFHQRINTGWRGRKAAITAIVGFSFIGLGFIFINLFEFGRHTFLR